MHVAQRISSSALYEISMQTYYICLSDMENRMNSLIL